MILILLVCATSALEYTPCSTNWSFVGPVTTASYGFNNDNNITDSGASHTIVGGYNGVWFLGTVNGGVWRTSNINVDIPHWVPVLDNQPVNCVSIGSIAVADFNPKLVAAGCGGTTSAEMAYDWNTYNDGDWGGLMLSQDGGDSWAMTNFPEDFYITSILFLAPSTIIVGTRSNFWNKYNAGIFVSNNLGASWNRTLNVPIFDIAYLSSTQQIFAAGVDVATVYVSSNAGSSWTLWSDGLDWAGYVPFYTTLAIQQNANPPVVFLAGLSVNPNEDTQTGSAVFFRPLSQPLWKQIAGGPDDLDDDHMPKDKLAILPDPAQTNLLYLAGNGESEAFRIDYTTGTWTSMNEDDTADGSAPHPDCRKLAWEPVTGSLLLTNDGGIYKRTLPRQKGGLWRGVQGDIQVMEIYFAAWDGRLKRWIGGGQDNCVQITRPASTGNLRSIGAVEGDGTRVVADNTHCPTRLIGSVQNLAGLAVFSGPDDFVGVQIPLVGDLYNNFTADFPYFITAYTLNTQDPDYLLYWVNGTWDGSRLPGFYRVLVPTSDTDPLVPELIVNTPDCYGVLDIVAGGYTNNVSNPNLLLAINNSHLIQIANNKVSYTPLPTTYSDPVHFNKFDSDGNVIIGPLSHGTTAWLAVSPADSNVIAITGWPQDWNNGQEEIWLSRDGGKTWKDITGNLYASTGTIERIRPSSVYIVEFADLGFEAILVGTVNGLYVTFTDAKLQGLWSRVGLFKDFPRVLVMGISYEVYSDTLVAATFGRGVYVIENAKAALLQVRAQQLSGSCSSSGPFSFASSARFFPPQQQC